MIPLYKLERLPRTQKLRKIAKIFAMAENRLGSSAEKSVQIFREAEFIFFTDAARFLASDTSFSTEAQKMFAEAGDIFKAAPVVDTVLFHRAINCIKHILHAETGREQADWDLIRSDGHLDPQKRQIVEGMWVYMEDIRSPFNVGAMFRTAESFGVEKIILSQFCADPHHRRAERTAMGCIEMIPWEKHDLFTEPSAATSTLTAPSMACPVFALETGGIPLAEFSFPQRGLLIVGSEELGVSPRALAAADASLGRVSIPCYGTKASLNVSVAFGIAVQAWRAAVRHAAIHSTRSSAQNE